MYTRIQQVTFGIHFLPFSLVLSSQRSKTLLQTVGFTCALTVRLNKKKEFLPRSIFIATEAQDRRRVQAKDESKSDREIS